MNRTVQAVIRASQRQLFRLRIGRIEITIGRGTRMLNIKTPRTVILHTARGIGGRRTRWFRTRVVPQD